MPRDYSALRPHYDDGVVSHQPQLSRNQSFSPWRSVRSLYFSSLSLCSSERISWDSLVSEITHWRSSPDKAAEKLPAITIPTAHLQTSHNPHAGRNHEEQGGLGRKNEDGAKGRYYKSGGAGRFGLLGSWRTSGRRDWGWWRYGRWMIDYSEARVFGEITD